MNLLRGQELLAAKSDTRRSMFVIRGGENEPYQVMVNTFADSTVPPIHKHKVVETFMCIEGTFQVFLYDSFDDMNPIIMDMLPGECCRVGADIFHTIVCTSGEGRVVEFKEGKYDPKADKEFLV